MLGEFEKKFSKIQNNDENIVKKMWIKEFHKEQNISEEITKFLNGNKVEGTLYKICQCKDCVTLMKASQWLVQNSENVHELNHDCYNDDYVDEC